MTTSRNRCNYRVIESLITLARPGTLASWHQPGVDKEVLMKVELLEAQDLCLATLEGHERLEYAKGTWRVAAFQFGEGDGAGLQIKATL